MTPRNQWEEIALRCLQSEAGETYRTLLGAGALDEVIARTADAALDRYAAMVDDGTNADTAREIALAEMRGELTGRPA